MTNIKINFYLLNIKIQQIKINSLKIMLYSQGGEF